MSVKKGGDLDDPVLETPTQVPTLKHFKDVL